MTQEMATTAAAVVKTQLERSLEKRSLSDLVKARKQRSLLLVDISGSMGQPIRTGGRKVDALRKVVTALRETHPVPVASFGGGAEVTLVDTIPEPAGCTPLHKAIDFGATKGATHLVVVTDGQPDSRSYAFDAATRFGGKIDCFYIGDGDDGGAEFCAELAKRTGGSANITDIGDDAGQRQLTRGIAGLLTEAVL
jgi:Mg-chelatase subunit ChlD